MRGRGTVTDHQDRAGGADGGASEYVGGVVLVVGDA